MKKKVYVYESDDGFDLFLSDRELSDEERYCDYCDEYATLELITTDESELISLFSDYGYTPECAKYQELLEQFRSIVGGDRVD